MNAAMSTVDHHHFDPADVSHLLSAMDAGQRVQWVMENLPGEQVLSSSFGAQASVMLHLMTQQRPDIPVVLVDTGYLFPETYQFVDELADRLSLNLKVYRSRRSPAWQEAAEGRRWEHGLSSLTDYNQENKVEPMRRALQELGAQTWFAGLRRSQSEGRSERQFAEISQNRWKIHPILDWTDRDVGQYLKKHELPYHPLWEQGYISIGDIHSTKALHEVDDPGQLRFNGLKRECGLHEM